MPEWTKKQRTAIEQTQRSLLVSAAAGSGKTATLSERCAHLACSGAGAVNQMLVVTFTEEAAAEMKSRIEKALIARLQNAPAGDTAKIRRQLALLPGAQVSTIHGFCSRILKRHFQEVALDPAFRVLEEQEAALLRREVADQLMEDAYAGKDRAFTALVDLYADGKDQRIEDQVIATHGVLRSLLDDEPWCAEALARLQEVKDKPRFFASRIGAEFKEMVVEAVQQLGDYCREVHAAMADLPDAQDCADVLEELAPKLDELLTLARKGEWEKALRELEGDEEHPFVPRLPSGQKSDGRDRAMKLRDTVTEPLKSKGDIYRYFARTPWQYREEIIGTLEVAEYFIGLVREFGNRYAAAKEQMNAVDFSDLEHLALRALENEEIASGYRRRFRFVMVDEFQDVNSVQWELLRRIAQPGADGTPGNLFCVGDVKQSIYRFRLADPTIFLEREKQWTPASTSGEVIHMQDNFRSRPALLEGINILFRQLMRRGGAEIEYDQSHELDGQRQFPAACAGSFTGNPIELHLLVEQKEQENGEGAGSDPEEDWTRTQREARHAARVVCDLMSSGRVVAEREGAYRPLRYGDIAILLRSAKFTLAEYSRALLDAGVPVFAESRSGFFKATEIADMLSLLRLLDNEQQDIPMAAFLRSPIARLERPEEALASIRVAYPGVPFHEALTTYAQSQNDELAAKLRQLLERLRRWRERSLMVSVAELLWEIYAETGYVAYCRGLKGGEQRVANLMYLHRCARQFSHFQRQGLYRFMEYLRELEEQQDLGQPSPGEPGDAVRVMTIHGSKGLEFPVVIVSGVGTRFNKRDAAGSIVMDRRRYLGVGVADEKNDIRYPSASSLLVKEEIDRATMAEELRVLYVAMTRAQEHLVLLGSCKEDEKKKLEALPPCGANAMAFRAAGSMLQWILPLAKSSEGALQVITVTDGIEEAEIPLAASTSQPAATDMLPVELWCGKYEFAPLTMTPATTSVTGLSKGNETPVADTPIDDPELAGLSEEARERGIAVHLFMEHLDLVAEARPLEQQLADLRARGVLSDRQASLVNAGDVRWLLEDSELAWTLTHHAGQIVRELPMLDTVEPTCGTTGADGFDRVILRGRIDAVLPTAEGIVVVDYKTDRTFPEPESERQRAYQEQVQLYRQTIARSGLGKVAGVYLVFLAARRLMRC